MKFGLTPEQYRYIFETVVKPLSPLGAKVWCYGSRARGDFKKFSDLDLMIEAPTDLSSTIGAMSETLEKSNFPYKVDLVQLRDFAATYRPGYEKDKLPFLEP